MMADIMTSRVLRANLMLVLAALIWGLAFVFQRIAAASVGSLTFNAARFFLGVLSVIPLIRILPRDVVDGREMPRRHAFRRALVPGTLAGFILFGGSVLQQMGLVGASAGKAAFITGLYIVLVPLAGLFFRHRPGLNTWAGALIATAGLWLLSVTAAFTISRWDLLVLIGAFFWTAHILVIGRFSERVPVLHMALVQYLVTAFLSAVGAAVTEPWLPGALAGAWIPIVYGGVCSVGIAFTLQIFGQKDSPPAAASLILSLETVFAALFGALFLGETLGGRELFGAALMALGMLLSQLNFRAKADEAATKAA